MPRRRWIGVRFLTRRASRICPWRRAVRFVRRRFKVDNVVGMLERLDHGTLALLLVPTRLAIGVDATLCEYICSAAGLMF